MPSANVEAVRRGVQAWLRGDIPAMLREYDPAVEVVDPERAGAGPFRGHEALTRWIEEWLESWDRYAVEAEAIIDAGDAVVVLQHHTGRAEGSGIEIDQRGALLMRLRDGKVVLHRPYTRRADALEAAGIIPGETWRATLETILTGYAAWNRGDLEALVSAAGPDMEFVPVLQSPDQPAFRIGDGVNRFREGVNETWEFFRFEPLAFVPAGDRLLVEAGVSAKARGSGIELQESWAHLFTLRDGRPVRLEAFTSGAEALAALAYPDQP